MTWWMWTLIGLGIYIGNALLAYTLLLYFTYRKKRYDSFDWHDKTFAEYVYDGDGIHTDSMGVRMVMWVPVIGQMCFWCEYTSEYHKYFKRKRDKNSNMFHKILKRAVRKQYLLERVSKEI